jgi:hypothetical protein
LFTASNASATDTTVRLTVVQLLGGQPLQRAIQAVYFETIGLTIR